MEINILLILKYLLGGAALMLLGWAGWMFEDRKTIKHRLLKLEKKVASLESKSEDNDSKVESLIDIKLKPIQISLDLMARTTDTINSNITKLIDKIDNMS